GYDLPQHPPLPARRGSFFFQLILYFFCFSRWNRLTEFGKIQAVQEPQSMSSLDRPWVDGLTFGQVLQETVQRFPNRDALVFPKLPYRRTYAEFHADVELAARALMASGIERGEHVGIWATNWPEWVIIQFAAAQAGTVLVNINPGYRAHELEYVLNQ